MCNFATPCDRAVAHQLPSSGLWARVIDSSDPTGPQAISPVLGFEVIQHCVTGRALFVAPMAVVCNRAGFESIEALNWDAYGWELYGSEAAAEEANARAHEAWERHRADSLYFDDK